MWQPISRRMHGLADYTYIPTVALAPKLAGFEDEEVAAQLCRIMSSGVAISAISTRAEWGLLRVMPFTGHLIVDFISGVFAAAAPWLFGFAGNARARNAFVLIGLISIGASTLSRPEEMPAS
jgi:hypothetical protein